MTGRGDPPGRPYSDAVAYLDSLVDYEKTPAASAALRQFNLDRMRWLVERTGCDLHGVSVLHVAGTKGKGSTCAMLASILQAGGYSVGLYTSPHLISFRERIRINGELVAEDDLARLVEQIRPDLESLRSNEEFGPPSFFEAYTLLAALHFSERKVDFAVLETGLGGRLDATNVFSPVVCGITTIARDHVVELGETLPEIAREKAGTIKPGVPVVCAPQADEVWPVIEVTCRERGAPLRIVTVGNVGQEPTVGMVGAYCNTPLRETIEVGLLSSNLSGLRFHLCTWRRECDDLTCALLGAHQLPNIGVAVGMIEELRDQGHQISDQAIARGLREVRWPGRLQIAAREPIILLDGAHDGASARALRQAWQDLFPGRKVVLILGISGDKQVEEIGAELCPAAALVIFTASTNPRAASPSELGERLGPFCARTQQAPHIAAALAAARQAASRDGLICVTGSLYLVGEAMSALEVEPGWR